MLAPSSLQAAPTESLAARVSRLEAQVGRLRAEAAIRRLLLDYGQDLDRRDFAAYARLFAPHGSWTGHLGPAMTSIHGRTAIREAMEQAFASAPRTQHTPQHSFHILTDALITVHGERAEATSKWTFVAIHEGKAAIVNAGTYHDDLIRRHGYWKFLHRTAPSFMIAETK